MKHDLNLSDNEVQDLVNCINKIHLQNCGYIVEFNDEFVDDLLCIKNKLETHLYSKDVSQRRSKNETARF